MENQNNLNGNMQPIPSQQPVQAPQPVEPQPVELQPVEPQQPVIHEQSVSQPPQELVQPVVEQPVQQVAQPQMMQPQMMQSQPMVQQQFSQPMQQPVMPQPIQPINKTNTVCVIAIILAFLMGPIGVIVGIVGLINANKKGEKGKGLAIAAIVIGILMPIILVFGIFGILLGVINGSSEAAMALREGCDSVDAAGNYVSEDGTVLCKNFYCEYEKGAVSLSSTCNLLDDEDRDSEKDSRDDYSSTTPTSSKDLQNTSWILTDNSELILDSSTFSWYKTKDVYNDNYFKGTYVYYVGRDAVNYVTTQLSNYGITKDELQGVFDRNEMYNEENFVVLVLQHTGGLIDGQDYAKSSMDPYYGFLLKDGTYLDVANMNNATYYSFSKRV